MIVKKFLSTPARPMIHYLIVLPFSFFLKHYYLFINLFIYLFLVALRCVFITARWLSLVGSERGLFFVAVCGLLIAVACLCCGAQALGTWVQ